MEPRTIAFALGCLVIAGCISYTPQELSAMSAYRLCELETVYRMNLTDEAKDRLRNELKQRKEDCSAHLPAIQAQREWDFERAVYGNQSP